MKTTIEWNGFSFRFTVTLARAFIIAGCLLCASGTLAQPIPGGGGSYPSYTPLDSWSFNDTTNWTSDNGYKPLSFTNITTAIVWRWHILDLEHQSSGVAAIQRH